MLGVTILLGILASAPPAAVRAASAVTVTRIDDPVPGGCKTTGTAPCSLREAVIYANNHPGTTITVPAGTYALTRMGVSEGDAVTGDLDIRADVTINGAGSATTIIDGFGLLDRIFDIYPSSGLPSVTVAINGVTIQKGRAYDTFGGGGFWSGDGAVVTLTDSVVADNTSTDGKGGGVVSRGTFTRLTLINTIVDHNDLTNLVLGGASTGGGVYAEDSTVLISNSTITRNTVRGAQAGNVASGVPGGGAFGGGVGGGGSAKVTIVNSTVDFNEVRGGNGTPGNGAENHGGLAGGGGIGTSSATGTWTVINSTVNKNDGVGGEGRDPLHGEGGLAFGGGIYLGGSVSLVNDTITGNDVRGGLVVGGGGTPGYGAGGGQNFFAGTGGFSNTIIAANRILTDTGVEPSDVLGGFTSGGHNLIGVRDGGSTLDPSDLSGSAVNPLDAKLAIASAINGGSTRTVALLSGSPAINAGDNAICARPLPPAGSPNGPGNVDQRGVARPQPVGGSCDIGAYEYLFAPSTTVLSSSANPAAVGQAITFTVTVAASGTPTGTVVLTDGPTSIGGGAAAGGVVTVTTAALTEGTHSITATYGGDALFGPSTSAISQVVGAPSLQFFPLAAPLRLLDTRPGHSAFVQPGTPLAANVPRNLPGHFTIGGVTVPAEALALVGNATVDNSAGVPPGFATIYPSGSALPLASNLNFALGTVRPNAFTVGLGSDGTFNLLSNTGGHFVVDITGYYAPPAAGGLFFHPLPKPVRLLDTRAGAPALVHPDVALTAGQTLNLPGRFTTGGVTVPASAKALAGNATVDNTVNAPPGFATLFPGGTTLPSTSNLNFAKGTIAPNAFTVGLGGDGSFNLFSNSGGNFILDISGYYDTVPSGGLFFHALTQPVRELDTRPGGSASVHPNAALSAAGTLSLPGSFTFAGITVPPTATALVGNATVDNTINAPAGFATIYPGGTTLPLASNLNYSPGLIAPNAFIVAVGSDGTYRLFSQSGSNFIIDISGYFSPS